MKIKEHLEGLRALIEAQMCCGDSSENCFHCEQKAHLEAVEREFARLTSALEEARRGFDRIRYTYPAFEPIAHIVADCERNIDALSHKGEDNG